MDKPRNASSTLLLLLLAILLACFATRAHCTYKPCVEGIASPCNTRSDPAVVVFDDDEQTTTGIRPQVPAGASSNGSLVVKTVTEWSAVARNSSSDNFAVLVHVTAPGISEAGPTGDAQPRAPLDLVTVLDVSASMHGQKLALLKRAMRFVVDNLGPDDRLSVVSFSSQARCVTRLARMTDDGKALAVSAVEALAAGGGTNIADGLRTAAKVLDERRHRNAVSSVVLLSDGQDTFTVPLARQRAGEASNSYEALVPPSFLRPGGVASAPVHTFGFGNDHDAAAMNVIAEATGGTFSFIENEAVVQDAFAQCIGGLLSVVVQEARIEVTSLRVSVSSRSTPAATRAASTRTAAPPRSRSGNCTPTRRGVSLCSFPCRELKDQTARALW